MSELSGLRQELRKLKEALRQLEPELPPGCKPASGAKLIGALRDAIKEGEAAIAELTPEERARDPQAGVAAAKMAKLVELTQLLLEAAAGLPGHLADLAMALDMLGRQTPDAAVAAEAQAWGKKVNKIVDGFDEPTGQ